MPIVDSSLLLLRSSKFNGFLAMHVFENLANRFK